MANVAISGHGLYRCAVIDPANLQTDGLLRHSSYCPQSHKSPALNIKLSWRFSILSALYRAVPAAAIQPCIMPRLCHLNGKLITKNAGGWLLIRVSAFDLRSTPSI